LEAKLEKLETEFTKTKTILEVKNLDILKYEKTIEHLKSELAERGESEKKIRNHLEKEKAEMKANQEQNLQRFYEEKQEIRKNFEAKMESLKSEQLKELEILKQEITDLAESKRTLANEFEALTLKFGAQEEKLKKEQNFLDFFKEQAQKTQSIQGERLGELSKIIEQKTEEYEQLSKEKLGADESVLRTKASIHAKSEENLALSRKIEILEADASKLRTECLQKDKKLMSEKQETEGAKTELLKEKIRLEEFQSQANELRSLLKQSRSENADFRDMLTTAVKRERSVKQKCKELRRKLEFQSDSAIEKTKQVDILRAEIESLSEKLRNCDALLATNKNNEFSKTALEAIISELKQSKSKLEEKLKLETEKFQDINVRFNALKLASEKQTTSLQTKVLLLNDQNETISKLREEKNTFEKELSRKEKQFESKKIDLAENYQTLEKKYQRLKDEFRSFQDKMDQIDEYEDTISTLKDTVQSLRERVAEKDEALEEVTDKIESIRDDFQKQLAAQQSSLEEKDNEFDELRKELSEKHEELGAAEQKIIQLRGQFQLQQEKLDFIQKRMEERENYAKQTEYEMKLILKENKEIKEAFRRMTSRFF